MLDAIWFGDIINKMSPEQFRISTRQYGDAYILQLKGSIWPQNIPILEKTIVEIKGHSTNKGDDAPSDLIIIFDLRHVNAAESAFFKTLLQLKKLGGDLRILFGRSSKIGEAFDILGLTMLFRNANNLEALL